MWTRDGLVCRWKPHLHAGPFYHLYELASAEGCVPRSPQGPATSKHQNQKMLNTLRCSSDEFP